MNFKITSTVKYFLLAITLYVFHIPLKGQEEADNVTIEAAKMNEERWLEDLEFMADKLRNIHFQPFTNITEEEFNGMVNSLKQNIPYFSDDEVIAAFSELVGKFGWGHTRINLPVNYEHLGFYQGHKLDQLPNPSINSFKVLPVRMVQFEEGIHIQSATEEYSHLIGKEVISIGNRTMEESLDIIKKYTSFENKSSLNLIAPVYLSIVNLLKVGGIIQDPNSIPLNLADGSTVSLIPIKSDEKVVFRDVFEMNHVKKPLWLSDTKSGLWQIATQDEFWTKVEQFFWFKYLPDFKTLYIKINYIGEHEEMSIAQFMHKAMGVVENHDVQKLVLDLRHNSGGMGDSNRAIELAVQRWKHISRFGSTFVLLGRQTYSAALLLALDLEKKANVIFAGEELGGKPDHIGDSKRFILPNSMLTFRVSVAKHNDWTGIKDRSSVWIHYPIPFSFTDYNNGRDAIMDFVLNFKDVNLKDEIIDIYKRTNVNVAILILYHLYTDPRESKTDHASIAHGLARYIFDHEKNVAYAKYITNVSLEYNSLNIPLLLLQAEIALSEDEPDNAKDSINKVLRIEPDNIEAKALSELLN